MRELKGTPVYDEIYDQGRIKGRGEGREEGALASARDSIRSIGETLVGPIPSEVAAWLDRETRLDQLNQYRDQILRDRIWPQPPSDHVRPNSPPPPLA